MSIRFSRGSYGDGGEHESGESSSEASEDEEAQDRRPVGGWISDNKHFPFVTLSDGPYTVSTIEQCWFPGRFRALQIMHIQTSILVQRGGGIN